MIKRCDVNREWPMSSGGLRKADRWIYELSYMPVVYSDEARSPAALRLITASVRSVPTARKTRVDLHSLHTQTRKLRAS